MRFVQRVSALVAWLSLATVATLMVLESARVVDDLWRLSISDVVAWLAQPKAEQWSVALLGGLVAIVALVLTVSQLTPIRRVVEGVIIDRTDIGSTQVSASTLYSRIGHELSRIDDVHTATPVPHPKRLKFRIVLTDTGNITQSIQAARTAMGSAFWASLGMEPRPVDLILTYRRGPTPISRKELVE